MIEERHFEKFITQFYGYGKWENKNWFLGIEEGGGNDIKSVKERLEKFYNWNIILDGLVDNFDFQSELSDIKYFGILDVNNTKTQKTWLPLLKSFLIKKLNRLPTIEEIKRCQIENFGRQKNIENDCALIELFPLPNSGIQPIKYSERWPLWTENFSDNWRLPNERHEYENFILPNKARLIDIRKEFITYQIKKHKPKNIIAYVGTNSNYVKIVTEIADVLSKREWKHNFACDSKLSFLTKDIIFSDNQKTRFTLTRHPSRTNHNCYWESVATQLI